MFDFFKKGRHPDVDRNSEREIKKFLAQSGTGNSSFFNSPPEVEINEESNHIASGLDAEQSKADDRIPASVLRGLLEHINQERRTFAYKISGNGIRSGYIPRAERNESDGDPYREMLASIEGLMDLSETNRKLMSMLELRDLLTDVLHNKGNFKDVVDFDK